MTRLFAFIIIVCSLLPTSAATDNGEQVLVFRNTGAVDLFYTNEIDSITFSKFDADSVLHEEITSQVFHTVNRKQIIPIAEIDSVAFGNHNETVIKENVRMITQDSVWIIRYDGSNVYYKPATPKDILPKVGEKVFYGKMDGMFPVGLCALVNNVSMVNNEYVVDVSDLELSEVFEKLFYAGPLQTEKGSTKLRTLIQKAPWTNKILPFDIEIDENGKVSGNISFDISGNVVALPLSGYYHLDSDISIGSEIGLSITQQKIEKVEVEKDMLNISLGVYALVFTPEISLGGFASFEAEMSANMKIGNSAKYHISYTKERGKDPVFELNNPEGADGSYTSQIDMTLNGGLALGGQATLDLNILKETAGAQLKMRVGPALEGEFGMGLLIDANEYNPSIYGKAKLSACIEMQAKGSLYIHDLIAGEKNEMEIFTSTYKLKERSIDLFPEYNRTLGIMGTAEEGNVTVSTKSRNEILHEVETGFELVDKNEEVVDSIFTSIIKSGASEVQGISAEFDLPSSTVTGEDFGVRPIFHYAGHTVRGELVSVRSNMQIQPMVFGMSNGAANVLSGIPFSGEAQSDDTYYIAGPYLPIAVRDTVFQKEQTGIIPGTYIEKTDQLVGEWNGTEEGTEVIYSFGDNGTGSLNGNAFTYKTNTPQSGDICIYLENGGTKVLKVIELSETTLKYEIRNSNTIYQLNKTK